MSKEAQNHYQTLKESNELEQVFPKASGNWEKDKVKFTKLYNENIKFIQDFESGNLDEYEIGENEYVDGSLY